MKSINLAIIGFGRIGKIHANNILAAENVNLKIIIDPLIEDSPYSNQLDIKNAKEMSSLLELDNIDGVIICSPSEYHIEHIRLVSQKIKHIFCEKPLGLTIDEIMQVKSLIKNNNLNLHVGFNRRFDPDFSKLKYAISEGEIGDIHTIKITSRDPSPPPISYIKISGGMFLDMTIHDFDMVKYLADSEISEIFAKGTCFINPEIKKANDIDTAIINMKLENGVLATINNSRQAVYGYDQRIEVLGSKGTLKVNNKLLHGIQRGTKDGFVSANPQNFFIDRYKRSYEEEILNFINSIRGESVDCANVDDGLHALKSGLAAKRSLEQNSSITI